MKPDVLRILNMVKEGKLSSEDAYELMDAFANFESTEPPAGPPPPPPPPTGDSKKDEPFRRLVDGMEKLTKDSIGSVDWSRVAEQVRTATKKGVEAVRDSVEQITKGEFKFSWFGPFESKTIELPIQITPGKTVRLERTKGDIKVVGGHTLGKVIVTATLRGKDLEDSRKKAEAWTPVIEEHDGGITLRQSPDTAEEDIEVQVPEGVIFDIRSDNGDVRVRDTKAALRLESKSGDCDVSGIRNSLELSSYAGDVKVVDSEAPTIEVENKSGDVDLVRVKGNITVRSASGDINGKEVAGSSISVETVSGDIDLDIAEPVSGTLNARTVSGDVLLDLPSGSNCRVTLSSLNGSASSRIDLTDEKRTEERITGTIGSGEETLDASAVSGDVRIAWRDHQ